MTPDGIVAAGNLRESQGIKLWLGADGMTPVLLHLAARRSRNVRSGIFWNPGHVGGSFGRTGLDHGTLPNGIFLESDLDSAPLTPRAALAHVGCRRLTSAQVVFSCL
jgi:hypothetical protein